MRFNHMYTIAFEVKTDHKAKDVKEHEILAALAGKLQDMIANKGEIFEAVGEPDDTVEEGCESDEEGTNPQIGDGEKDHGQGDVLTFQTDGAPVMYTEQQRDRDKGRNWDRDADVNLGDH